MRASVVFQLSSLLAVLQRAARATADCDEWDAIVAGGSRCLPARPPRFVRVGMLLPAGGGAGKGSPLLLATDLHCTLPWPLFAGF